MNCVERQPSTTPTPSPPPPLRLPFKKKENKPPPTSPSPPSRAHPHRLIVNRRKKIKNDKQEVEQLSQKSRHRSPVVTLKIVCFGAFGFEPPASGLHSHPPPHRATLTSDCGVMATTMRTERDFTERTFLCFRYFARPAKRKTLLIILMFCSFALVLTSGFGKVLV